MIESSEDGFTDTVATPTLQNVELPIELTVCPACKVSPGHVHNNGCYVELCSVCGKQRHFCRCIGHDNIWARWTGIVPGVAESRYLKIPLQKFMNQYRKIFYTKPK